MKCFAICALFSVLILPAAFAQIMPQGSHVQLYFPEVADGGGEWQTTFTFVNPDDSIPAPINLYLFKEDGSGLPVDFGSGAAALPQMAAKLRLRWVFRSFWILIVSWPTQ